MRAADRSGVAVRHAAAPHWSRRVPSARAPKLRSVQKDREAARARIAPSRGTPPETCPHCRSGGPPPEARIGGRCRAHQRSSRPRHAAGARRRAGRPWVHALADRRLRGPGRRPWRRPRTRQRGRLPATGHGAVAGGHRLRRGCRRRACQRRVARRRLDDRLAQPLLRTPGAAGRPDRIRACQPHDPADHAQAGERRQDKQDDPCRWGLALTRVGRRAGPWPGRVDRVRWPVRRRRRPSCRVLRRLVGHPAQSAA